MFTSSIALALLSALVGAAPVQERQTTPISNFYLVTTSSSTSSSNSSTLPNVKATSLFDPYHQTTMYLRTIDPGYNSLPQFNLTEGTLHTLVSPLGNDPTVVKSTALNAPQPLSFDPYYEGVGSLALQDGYLLTVDGDAENWTICKSTYGEDLITWRGGEGCTKTYIQAVSVAPY